MENDTNAMIYGFSDWLCQKSAQMKKTNGFCFDQSFAYNMCLVFQVPDNAVMALVPKQVTAYNSVNNSTVSRTSASKYGKTTCFCKSLSFPTVIISY